VLLHLIDSIMFHSPPIEGLRRSEVIINHFAFSVHQSSELGQLGAGDLQRSLEVDPFNHLIASRCGQTAIVCAVSGAGGGDHGVDQVVQLEAGVGKVDLTPGAGDLAQGVSKWLQRRVLRLK